MQCRIICKIFYNHSFFSYWVSGLLAVLATTAMAENGFSQSSPRYSAQQYPVKNISEYNKDSYKYSNKTVPLNPTRLNTWSLPQRSTNQPASTLPETYYGQSGAVPDQRLSNGRSHKGQFVTPEILKSLKQQQKQYQTMPDSQSYYSNGSRNNRLLRPDTGWSGQSSSKYPVYGAGTMNPLYDAPAVSPWGSGMDVLNRGEAFPMVPSEAVGGLSPMYVPSFGMNNYKGGNKMGEADKTDDINIFNPFTFLPNSGVRAP